MNVMRNIIGSADAVTVIHSPLHGHGVQALLPIAKGSVIFAEKPHLFLQSLPNRRSVLVCGCCAHYLGSVGLQMKFLQNYVSREDIFNGSIVGNYNPYHMLTQNMLPCLGGCGELYCSLSCRDHHWHRKGHKYLCTGQINPAEVESHPLFAFKVHAVQTNEIFLLVADVFAELCATYEQIHLIESQPRDVVLDYLKNYFEGYVRQMWWEAAQPAKGQSKAKLTKTLKSLVSESYSMLVDSLPVEKYGLQSVLSEEFMSRCIGMFEQNNVGVRFRSSISAFMDGLDSFVAAEMYAKELLNDIRMVSVHIDNEDCMEDCGDDEYEDIDDEEEAMNEEIVENIADTDVTTEPASEYEEAVETTGNPDLDSIHEVINEYGEENLFPPLDGTAFYFMICKINHSCIPNVIVKYNTIDEGDGKRGLVAHLVALTDIVPGEELVQSYVDSTLSTTDRQKLLAEYGFRCQCAKCAV